MTSRPRPGPGADAFDLALAGGFGDFAAARRDVVDDDSGMMR
jgi:hypothetical protein